MKKLTTLMMVLVGSCAANPSFAYDIKTYDDNYKTEMECLAKNIYFEARGETDYGKLAVMNVTLNRVDSDKFPNTICEVVHQGVKDSRGNMKLHQCQFSWYCDGLADTTHNMELYEEIYEMAELYMMEKEFYDDISNGALFYHTDYVQPFWSKADSMTQVAMVDSHIFYVGW